MIEIVFLSLFVLIPAALIAFIPPFARRVLFVLGLIAFFGSDLFMGGPDNPLLIFPLVGIGVALGALLVEAAAFVRRLLNRRGVASHG